MPEAIETPSNAIEIYEDRLRSLLDRRLTTPIHPTAERLAVNVRGFLWRVFGKVRSEFRCDRLMT